MLKSNNFETLSLVLHVFVHLKVPKTPHISCHVSILCHIPANEYSRNYLTPYLLVSGWAILLSLSCF